MTFRVSRSIAKLLLLLLLVGAGFLLLSSTMITSVAINFGDTTPSKKADGENDYNNLKIGFNRSGLNQPKVGDNNNNNNNYVAVDHTNSASVRPTQRHPPSSVHYANGAANRSPPRPPIELHKSNFAGYTSGTVTTTNVYCWYKDGKPCAMTPTWAAKLMVNALPYYNSLRYAVSDEWRILIGWIPGRFFGPQKPGRKANGDIQYPPTRGRDINYYLKEYNSSWHTSFEDNGMMYHFQVMHRNSLAVCIRERLYIHAIHLSFIPTEAPLLVYHCPCRHCTESATRNTENNQKSLTELFPAYVSPLLHAGGSKGPSRNGPGKSLNPNPYTTVDTSDPIKLDEISCLSADAAPWLAPKEHVFVYEGYTHDFEKMLQLQSNSEGIIMVVFFNKFWIDHLHNYVFSMVHRAQYKNYIVATTDDEALQLCIANRLPCFDATSFAEFEEEDSRAKGHMRRVTEAMSWIKPRLAVAVLEHGYHFYMSDLDISFNFNPLFDMVASEVDLAHQCDANMKSSINSGVYLARSNQRTIRFFHNLMIFPPDENADQTAMKLVSRYDTTHGINHTCLPFKAFNMKCYYKVPNSVEVHNGIQTFKWQPFERDRHKFHWKLLHATCISGAHQKILYLRTMNAWFLDILDNYTSKGGYNGNQDEYCIELKSKVGQKTSITTQHSAKYSRNIDNTYLQIRH